MWDIPLLHQFCFQFLGRETEMELPGVGCGDAACLLADDDAEGIAFYRALNAFTVSANTAYIEALPTTARFIGFNLDESTGIDGIAAEKVNNGEVYNLQGQRVVKAQKGLYIINGKKVLVK